MNRPLNDSDWDHKLANVAFVCFIVILLGCFTWIGMAGIYIWLGQDRAMVVILLNNTGQKLTITSWGQTHVLPSGDSVRGLGWEFTILAEKGEKWSYQLAPIKQEYFYLQIERDGKIYLLPEIPRQPIHNLPSQPDRYPLSPQ
jgi:hypothetical protein